MKRLILLLCLLLAVGCGAQDIATTDELKKAVDEGALVVDVRTQGEFDGGHLEKALHLPYQQILELPKKADVSKDSPIIVYCRSGGRSSRARASLIEAGYTKVLNGGGYESLKEAGF